MPGEDLQPGRIIGGRFRIVEIIGKGGMGTVYKARHVTLPRTFAIKILNSDLVEDEAFVERFRREAFASSKVEHPNVIYITDFGRTDDGEVYLVMEYLEGTGLDEVLAQRGRLAPNRAVSVLAQVADALDVAHSENVVHRDLKPENIVLTERRGRKDFVKLLDFGIAKVRTPEFDGAPLTIQGEVFGTAEYMSPEQATGKQVDGRSDIYALGCLAYELLTGDPPFLGSAVAILRDHVYTQPAPPSTKLPDAALMPALDAMVLRCLSKNPTKRYQTGAELRHDLMRTRALMFSMPGETAMESRLTSRMAVVPADEMTSGWGRLGGRVPEMLLPGGADPVLSASPLAAVVTGSFPASPETLRQAYHDTLREVATGLDKAALAPPEIGQLLEQLLGLDQEVASLTGAIALAEQNFERIRYDYAQRERQLRHAMLSLHMEGARLQGQATLDPASAPQIQLQMEDLGYQVSELSRRCDELGQERDARIRAQDEEVKVTRQRREELEQQGAQVYQNIHSQVEVLRSSANTDELVGLYAKLDNVR